MTKPKHITRHDGNAPEIDPPESVLGSAQSPCVESTLQPDEKGSLPASDSCKKAAYSAVKSTTHHTFEGETCSQHTSVNLDTSQTLLRRLSGISTPAPLRLYPTALTPDLRPCESVPDPSQAQPEDITGRNQGAPETAAASSEDIASEDIAKDITGRNQGAPETAAASSEDIAQDIANCNLDQTPPEETTNHNPILLTDVINYGLGQLPKNTTSRLEDRLLQFKDGHQNTEVNLLLQYLFATMPKE